MVPSYHLISIHDSKEQNNSTSKVFRSYKLRPKMEYSIEQQRMEKEQKEAERRKLLSRAFEPDELPPPIDNDLLFYLL